MSLTSELCHTLPSMCYTSHVCVILCFSMCVSSTVYPLKPLLNLLDLYLHAILISRGLIRSNYSTALETNLVFWLQFLVLSWVHDDKAIQDEGARWASEVSSTAPAQASDVFAHSGRFKSHHFRKV